MGTVGDGINDRGVTTEKVLQYLKLSMIYNGKVYSKKVNDYK